MIWLAVALGGAMGASARYGIGLMAARWQEFPYGTLAINIVGSLLMGLFIALFAKHEISETWRAFLTIGILGGFTTFSAFSLDSVLLIERGQIGLAVIYIGASVTLSIMALGAGLLIMRGAL